MNIMNVQNYNLTPKISFGIRVKPSATNILSDIRRAHSDEDQKFFNALKSIRKYLRKNPPSRDEDENLPVGVIIIDAFLLLGLIGFLCYKLHFFGRTD